LVKRLKGDEEGSAESRLGEKTRSNANEPPVKINDPAAVRKKNSLLCDGHLHGYPSILKDFPLFAARITFADLIEILPRQKPRY
jgi:hypothetical protein